MIRRLIIREKSQPADDFFRRLSDIV